MGAMDRLFTRFAGLVSSIVGQPAAFVLALTVIIVWGVTGPIFGYSDTWQLIINTATTIVTVLRVFLIQNSQNRDAAAMQAKLDELLRAVDKARGHFIGIEHLTDAQIERIREALERETGNHKGGNKSGAEDSVDRLLDRF